MQIGSRHGAADGRPAFRVALSRAAWILVAGIASGCTASVARDPTFTPRLPALEPAASALGECPYLTFYVVTETLNPSPRTGSMEPVRTFFLEAASQSLSAIGFQRIEQESDASWTLFAQSGRYEPAGDWWASSSLIPTVRFDHHRYIASMADEEFPMPPVLGSSSTLAFTRRRAYQESRLWKQASAFAETSWKHASATVTAICAVRQRLLSEEGTTLEQLRVELVEEMNQIRQRRREEHRKKLELHVEDRPQP